jgi:DNA-binding response OmpR family regulator
VRRQCADNQAAAQLGSSRRGPQIRAFSCDVATASAACRRGSDEPGTRAFDLLLVLLDADGSLVTKDELISRVWPGIVVSEENLKVQVSALRKALGEDRSISRTEFGRGYRFTGVLCGNTVTHAHLRPTRPKQRSRRTLLGWPVVRVEPKQERNSGC